jgi:hypothetical protein
MRGIHPTRTDGLLLLYSLADGPRRKRSIRYGPHITHELTAYAIDGGEQIRFDRNMWRQPELKPVLPALVAFQFKAGSDEDAIGRIQAMLDEVLAGKAIPNVSEHWLARFPDAIDLSKPILDFDDPDADLRLVDDCAGCSHLSKPSCPVNIARRFPLSNVLGLAAATVGLCGLPTVAEPVDIFGSHARDTDDVITRWMVLNDGHQVRVRITKMPGDDRRRFEVLTPEFVQVPIAVEAH